MKKPETIRIIQETGGALVPLKVWSRQNWRQEDWDFSMMEDFPHGMLRLAWLYEVDRELGSGNLPYFVVWETLELAKRKARLKADLESENIFSPDRLSERALLALLPEIPPDKTEMKAKAELEKMLKPDMTIAESEAYREKGWALDQKRFHKLNAIVRFEVRANKTTWKPPVPKEPLPILKSHRHDEFAQMKVPGYDCQWVDGNASSHCTIHPLEIDWTLTETKLVEAFRNWLREGDHAPFHPGYRRMKRDSKVGKRKNAGWQAWLRELAIYRISEAGITRKVGLAMIGGNNVSPANWEHAQSRTRVRIAKELKRCKHAAWDQGNGTPDTWRDWFVKHLVVNSSRVTPDKFRAGEFCFIVINVQVNAVKETLI